MKGFKINRWYSAFLGLLVLYSLYPDSPQKAPSPLESEKHDSDYFMRGVVIHLFDPEGQQLSQMKSVKLAHFKHHDQSLLESPIIQFNQASGHRWQLSAKQGKILNNKQQLEMSEQVTIEEINQQSLSTRITTQNLLLDLQNITATTDAPITISHQYYKTHSLGMDMDFKKHIINLNHEVITELKP